MMKRMTAILLALMLLTPFAFATEGTTGSRVLAKVDDKEILQSDADLLMPSFVNYNYVSSASDYQTVVTYLVQQEVLNRKIADMKFDQFTAEEETALRNEANKEWEAALDQYVKQYLSEDTDAARAKTREEGVAFYTSRGLTEEKLFDSCKYNASVDKMRNYLVGNYEPSEEEINTLFNEVGANYQAQYEGNIAMYETMTQLSGQESWYTPEGYRGIIHILLKVDPAVLEQYTAMQAAYEEQAKAGEKAAQPEASAQPEATTDADPVTEPVTEQQVNDARQAVLDSKKKEIDDIYDRLANGEKFEDLIKQYGEDPGMEREDFLKNGYSVHKDSAIYDPVFTKAAFSDKMQKVGDVSDPAVGTFGIHILKYQRDVPSGLVMTDNIRTEIVNYLKAKKEAAAFEEAITGWEKALTITYNQENIDLASKEAVERLAKEEAESAAPAGVEAVPAGDATEAPAAPEATAAPGN